MSAVCVPESCDMMVPENGQSGNCQATVLHGSSCIPTCNEGYTLSGTSNCSFGDLTPAACAPKACTVAIPANGFAGDCSPELPHGQTCTPECSAGFVLSAPTSCALGELHASECDQVIMDTTANTEGISCAAYCGTDPKQELGAAEWLGACCLAATDASGNQVSCTKPLGSPLTCTCNRDDAISFHDAPKFPSSSFLCPEVAESEASQEASPSSPAPASAEDTATAAATPPTADAADAPATASEAPSAPAAAPATVAFEPPPSMPAAAPATAANPPSAPAAAPATAENPPSAPAAAPASEEDAPTSAEAALSRKKASTSHAPVPAQALKKKAEASTTAAQVVKKNLIASTSAEPVQVQVIKKKAIASKTADSAEDDEEEDEEEEDDVEVQKKRVASTTAASAKVQARKRRAIAAAEVAPASEDDVKVTVRVLKTEDVTVTEKPARKRSARKHRARHEESETVSLLKEGAATIEASSSRDDAVKASVLKFLASQADASAATESNLPEVHLTLKGASSSRVQKAEKKMCADYDSQDYVSETALTVDSDEKMASACGSFCGLSSDGSSGKFVVQLIGKDASCYCASERCTDFVPCESCVAYVVSAVSVNSKQFALASWIPKPFVSLLETASYETSSHAPFWTRLVSR